MAQFDVYINPNPATSMAMPYLLDLQSDLLEPLMTRVVAPLLLRQEVGYVAKILNPCFEIEGQSVVLSTAELAGIINKNMGDRIGSLEQYRDEIIAALGLLFTEI